MRRIGRSNDAKLALGSRPAALSACLPPPCAARSPSAPSSHPERPPLAGRFSVHAQKSLRSRRAGPRAVHADRLCWRPQQSAPALRGSLTLPPQGEGFRRASLMLRCPRAARASKHPGPAPPPHPARGNPPTSHPNSPNKINATPTRISPPSPPALTLPPVPPSDTPGVRAQRGGIGAEGFERSQARSFGVRGKWSPPGDVGARFFGFGRSNPCRP